jgi:hypothetical protein
MFSHRMFRHKPTTAQETEQGRAELPIHADGATGIFHLPGCILYNSPESHIKFKNTEVAKKAGFVPYALCAPTGKDEHTTVQ